MASLNGATTSDSIFSGINDYEQLILESLFSEEPLFVRLKETVQTPRKSPRRLATPSKKSSPLKASTASKSYDNLSLSELEELRSQKLQELHQIEESIANKKQSHENQKCTDTISFILSDIDKPLSLSAPVRAFLNLLTNADPVNSSPYTQKTRFSAFLHKCAITIASRNFHPEKQTISTDVFYLFLLFSVCMAFDSINVSEKIKKYQAQQAKKRKTATHVKLERPPPETIDEVNNFIEAAFQTDDTIEENAPLAQTSEEGTPKPEKTQPEQTPTTPVLIQDSIPEQPEADWQEPDAPSPLSSPSVSNQGLPEASPD